MLQMCVSKRFLCAKKMNLTSQCLLTNSAAKHHPIVKDDACITSLLICPLCWSYLFSADVECQTCPTFPIKFRRNNSVILFQEQIFTRHKAVKLRKF